MTAMNRIIWHHTGGHYMPNAADKAAYHRLIDGEGAVHAGRHAIAANAPGRRLAPGTYAAHCLNLNSGSIGVTICAMADANWGDMGRWKVPVRPVQVDAMIRETARLCRIYGIVPNRQFTLSHAEVEITLGVAQRNKWDFDYPPRGGPGARDPIAIGDELRAELRRAIADEARTGGVTPPVPTHARPVLRQGSNGTDVRHLQAQLGGIAVDGIFGPMTRAAVVAFQQSNELLPDGIVGRMTWTALDAARR